MCSAENSYQQVILGNDTRYRYADATLGHYTYHFKVAPINLENQKLNWSSLPTAAFFEALYSALVKDRHLLFSSWTTQ